MNALDFISQQHMKANIPEFHPGDTVKVHVKITEGDSTRIQIFQGIVIQRRGGGINETFTVRKVIGGIGVERIFPLHSPNVDKIEVVKRGSVRRAKLFFLRNRIGKKATKIKEKKKKMEVTEE